MDRTLNHTPAEKERVTRNQGLILPLTGLLNPEISIINPEDKDKYVRPTFGLDRHWLM